MEILKNVELNVGEKNTQMKMARTEINNKRNYSLWKAEELLKGHSSVSGQEVKINWKTDEPGIRNVKVGQFAAAIKTISLTKQAQLHLRPKTTWRRTPRSHSLEREHCDPGFRSERVK